MATTLPTLAELALAQCPSRQMDMPLFAADEHDLAHGPADRIDRMLIHPPLAVEERHVRRKVRPRRSPQTFSQHRRGKRLSKRSKPAQSGLPAQDERMIAGLAAETRGEVERHGKWRGCSRFSCGLAG